MRVCIEATGSNSKIPFDYQYQLASCIYNRIDEKYNDLCDINKYKFYTFSWLDFEDLNINKGFNFSKLSFYFSSPIEDLSRFLVNDFINNPNFKLFDIDLEVSGVRTFPEKEIGEDVVFKTLSPIFMKTKRNIDGELKVWDLMPWDEEWRRNLSRNLVDRYNMFFNDNKDYNIEVGRIGDVKQKRIDISGIYNRCVMLTLEMFGDGDVLKFAYDSGLGEKTGMGFGFVEAI